MKTILILILAASAALAQLPQRGGGGGGSSAATDVVRASFCMAGTCNGDTLTGRWSPLAATPVKCIITASTAPSSTISIDVLKNGTTSIFTSPIQLTSGQSSASVTTFAAVTFNTTTDYATLALTGTSGQGVVLSCKFSD
jgi:hypothetical protein